VPKQWDQLWIDCHLATMVEGRGAYGAIPNGALAVKDRRIAWVGAAADLHGDPDTLATEVIFCGGAWLTPGLIDCHTHLIFGGNRAREFEMRLKGASYEDIAREGGGIISTVKATREASLDQLIQSGEGRLCRLMAEGVTTVEIKSGYGLDTENELKMLKAATALGENLPVRVRRTFLGAHAIPPEFGDDRSGYLDLVCNEMIPAVAREGLGDAVDAFCENIAFTREEVERVFGAALDAGLPIKLHAEQLSDQKGAALAARMGALSADHLEYLDSGSVAAMAKTGTVAVLLPGAFYYLRETKLPPIEELRAANVPIALATDANPGSSPILSPLTILNMGCTLFGLTPEEALAGLTRNGARALGLGNDLGTLEEGKAADFCRWCIDSPAELAYWVGANPLEQSVFEGRVRPR
jgi:imidazolonepropionase